MRFRVFHLLCGSVLAAGLGLMACTPQIPAEHDSQAHREQTDQGIGHTGSVPHLRADVIHTFSHDRSSFTQGLELAGGILYEGTGEYAESALRALDPSTGQVRREVRLPPHLFGEGITVNGDRIWQLTWQEEVAIKWDVASLTEVGRAHYSGEGWGLCHDGARLVMSNGSSRLTFRDPETFAEIGNVPVTLDGHEVEKLNELECTGDEVWANVWGSDRILQIDLRSGRVTAVVDASGLLSPGETAGADVLNGIAAIPGTDEFFLTGKNWPRLFRVRFVP